MRLEILVPTHVALEEQDVDIVNAQGENGSFGLLPHHIDFVSALVPGLLAYRRGGQECFVGVDEGLLVKRGSTVTVATARATQSADLGRVQRLVRESFAVSGEQEQRARSALAKLEADVVRRIIELEAEHEG